MGISEKEVKIRRMTEADLQKVKEIDRLLVGEGRALSWSLRAEMLGFLLGDIRACPINPFERMTI